MPGCCDNFGQSTVDACNFIENKKPAICKYFNNKILFNIHNVFLFFFSLCICIRWTYSSALFIYREIICLLNRNENCAILFLFFKDEIYSCILIQLLCELEINCSLIYADPGIAFNRKVWCLFRVRASSHLRIAVHKCIFI